MNRYESETYSGSFDYTNSLNRSQNLVDSALSNPAFTLPRSEPESAILVSRHSSGLTPDTDLPKPKPTPSPQFSAVTQDESGFDDVGEIDVRSIYELQSKKCDALPSVPPSCLQEVSQTAVADDELPMELTESKPFSRRRARVHAPAITPLNSIFSPPSVPPPPPPAVMVKPVQLVRSPIDCKRSVSDKPVSDKPINDKPVSDKPISDKPVSDKPINDKPINDKPVTPTSLQFPLDTEMTDPPKFPQYSTGRRNAL